VGSKLIGIIKDFGPTIARENEMVAQNIILFYGNEIIYIYIQNY
jgi:hypothetical protein